MHSNGTPNVHQMLALMKQSATFWGTFGEDKSLLAVLQVLLQHQLLYKEVLSKQGVRVAGIKET